MDGDRKSKPVISRHIEPLVQCCHRVAERRSVVNYMISRILCGQVLFVPRHWWHYVESLDAVTVSVNSWIELVSLAKLEHVLFDR